MVPQTILRQLARLRWQERRLALSWGAARWVALAAAVLVVACFTDWLIDSRVDTPWSLRLAMSLGQVLLSAAALYLWVVKPLRRGSSDDQVALWAEEERPDFAQRLISSVQLNRPGAATRGMSPEMIAAVTRETEDLVGRVDLAGLADRRRLRWSASIAGPVLGLIAILAAIWPGL